MGGLFDHVSLLEKGLDASWLRNEVISNNIANSDTPGFKTSSVEFESIFKDALGDSEDTEAGDKNADSSSYNRSLDSSEIDNLNPVIVKDNNTSMRMDGNNVDVNNEMTELAKNILLYNTLSQKVSKELSMIKRSINEIK